MALLDFFTIVGVFVFLYYLIYIIFMCIVDCDLGLAYSEKFGASLHTLKDKIIWITGASSGIGKHTAIECAKYGAKLVLTGRREDELKKVKEICLEGPGNLRDNDVLVLPLDLLKFDQHQSSFDKVLEHFGTLDILVNNAGRSQRADWENIELDVDRQMFELNVFSVVSLSRIAVKYFLERGHGHVAVTSSGAGIIGVPYSGSYTAAKHAIHGYFESLRTEKAGRNLAITLFCPGPTFTGFLQESFTDKKDKKYGITVAPTDRRMTGERCGELFAIALANKLDLAWATIFPISPLLYSLYFPNLKKLVMNIVGVTGMHKLRDGKTK